MANCGVPSELMEPSSRVRRALRNRDNAQLTLERARTELHDAIVADLNAGVRQAELVRLTGYSRERIRQLAKAAHVDAAERPRGTPRI